MVPHRPGAMSHANRGEVTVQRSRPSRPLYSFPAAYVPRARGRSSFSDLVGLSCHPPTVAPTQPKRLRRNPNPEAKKPQARPALGLSGPVDLLYVAIHAADSL